MSRKPLILSLVQFPVVKGDIRANLRNHLACVEQAATYKADVVVFPELSLTGYEPELAGGLAIDLDSSYLERLSKAAVDNRVIIVSGCPIQNSGAYPSKPYIGALISYPSGTTEVYRKQYLHKGEENYFAAGSSNYSFCCRGYKIFLAICADFSHPLHSRDAHKGGADIYLVSALISEKGFEPDSRILLETAQTYGFTVLLSNHSSETGGWLACGKSRAWDKTGQVKVAATHVESALVLCSVVGTDVSGQVINITAAPDPRGGG